ncbi:MAG: hypothetical protein K9L66_01215 [Spirochaetaceae bacterium]|nr:hypothetical protein [Spirochaetaceae bacterium]MCF7947026.1 hypothetical protein [Spirochaetia bacterium]MCF7950233.1 hypothetical protein [Spirochaetaceae bacterium]
MTDKHRFYQKATLFTYAVALFLLTSISGGTLWAQDSYWEGNVTTAPYGLLPHSGMYAASNAFPLDTKVSITHPSDATTIEVRIVARLDRGRVFMQVSRDAAQKLGIREDEIITVQVTPVEREDDLIESSLGQEKPFSADPDLNPSEAVQDESLALVQEYLAEQPEPEPEPEPEERVAVVQEPEPPEETEQQDQDTVSMAEEETEAAPVEEEVIEEITQEPQADTLPVRVQPRSKLTVVLPEPSRVPDETVSPSETTGPRTAELEPLFMQQKDKRYTPNAPELPQDTAVAEGPSSSLEAVSPLSTKYTSEFEVSHSPEPPPALLPSTDLASAEVEAEPEEEGEGEPPHSPLLPVAEESELAERSVEPEPEEEIKELPEDAELVLVPAEERPPEGPVTEPKEQVQQETETAETEKRVTSAAEEVSTGDIAAGDIAVKRSIDKDSYYLQVAAYSKLDLAQSRGQELSLRYPVTLYMEERASAAPYKLMIGPLNEDESGTLLYTFTSRGFRDAFIRKGN